jgi:hypothetical protein
MIKENWNNFQKYSKERKGNVGKWQGAKPAQTVGIQSNNNMIVYNKNFYKKLIIIYIINKSKKIK